MLTVPETTEVVIDKPSIADIEGIAGLRTGYWEELREAHGNPQQPHDKVMRDEKQYARTLLSRHDRYTRIARNGERIAGMLTGTSMTKDQYEAKLHFLMVSPEFRFRGLGRQLVIGYMASIEPGVPIRVYPYGPDDQALIRFYEGLGFEPCQEVEDFMVLEREG